MHEVSVLMSVYNAERYVGEAIESILGQGFRDVEFIIVDDGSTDGTSEILRGFQDDRVILVRNEENIGLTRSLNRGLELARGKYIARLDADDVSLPDRLEKQVQFLDAHPDVGLVGCAAEYIDPRGNTLGVQRPLRENLSELLTRHNWFNHSTVVFRRECLDEVGPYREAFRYAQDYDLWLRIAEKYEVACMPEPLVRIRFSPDSFSASRKAHQRAYIDLAIELGGQRRETGKDLLQDSAGKRELDLERLAKPTTGSLARGWLRTGCLHYLLGDIPRAKQSIAKAIVHQPELLREADRIVEYVVGFGLSYATELDSRHGAVQFVHRVFSNLPPPMTHLTQLKSKATARVYITSAFESYETHDFSRVRRDLPLAIYHDPSWLRNRGVWSILVRSFVRGLFFHKAQSSTQEGGLTECPPSV